MISKLKNAIRSVTAGISQRSGTDRPESDYERWQTEENLSSGWDSRTRQLAKLIEPGASVIEFGAGRQVLKTCLPEGCSYTPSDIVDRGSGTVVCDLNDETLPAFQTFDVAVFSGVLEYVNDLPRLISHLSNYTDEICASYAVTETNKRSRRDQGWVNDYSSAQLIDLFRQSGFDCRHTEKWRKQNIYVFSKRAGAGAAEQTP